MNLSRENPLFRIAMAVALLALAGGGYYLLRYQVWTAYRTWSIGRMNGMARDFIAAKDPRNAMLTVRKVLSSRPNDAEALKLGVRAAEMDSSGEAVIFQRNLCRIRKTTENYIELMRLALKHGAYGYGVEAIGAVAQDAKDSVEYHRMAAEIYRKIHREVPAKYQLISLLSLQPEDRPARLALAEVEFEMGPEELPADWKNRVAELAKTPETELAATLLQLREAVARGSAGEAAALAAKLRSRGELALSQRLYMLQAAYLYDPQAAAHLLADLQKQVAERPADVVLLMDFLSRASKSDAVQAWYPALPPAAKNDGAVKFAVAEALKDLKDWPGLEALLREGSWEKDDYLRMALLAYVYRMTGRMNLSAESWKIAMNSAGQDLRKMSRLIRDVEQWRWENERYELLWRIFNVMPTNEAVQKFLVAREYRDGNTLNLNRLYARVMEADPRDDAARNNFAYTSLLLDTNSGRAQTIARELFKKHPENVSYRTTYTLALHKQGQSAEALALMEKLDAATLLSPVPAVHEAAYAAAAGQFDRAASLLPSLKSAQLLPEQRRLADTVRMEIARHETTEGRRTELAGMDREADGGATQGWLALLPARAAGASLDFKLSASYYARNDFAALRGLLKGARWEGGDHLRYALLAFAERSGGATARAVADWRQAVATAGRDPVRLHELETLAAKWGWQPERMDIVARLFERRPADRAVLSELLEYYRNNLRTADMARVLWQYVNQTNASDTEAAWCVYYSLLCGLNESPAQTLAARVYDSAPEDPRHRVAYAFALWRQRRAAEALKLVEGLDAPELTGMKVSLIEAGTLLELGRKEEAGKILEGFTPANAMPEEISLAATLLREAGLPSSVNAFTLR